MTPQRRGVCAHCFGEFTLRVDGTLRLHSQYPYSDRQWDCPGSRKPPREEGEP